MEQMRESKRARKKYVDITNRSDQKRVKARWRTTRYALE